MKRNHLSWSDAWQKLLCGEHIAAVRLNEGGWCYLRRQAYNIGRTLVDSGIGSYRTYSLG